MKNLKLTLVISVLLFNYTLLQEGWFWQNPYPTGNDLHSVYFVNQNIGWAVGLHGSILKTTNGGVSFVEEKDIDEIPNHYYLSNNYPNPFNPSTMIKFTIADFGFTILKVYDVLGNEVATLVDEYKPAGSYEVEFNSVGTSRDLSLTSGVYFYQLKIYPANGGTNKMRLIRIR